MEDACVHTYIKKTTGFFQEDFSFVVVQSYVCTWGMWLENNFVFVTTSWIPRGFFPFSLHLLAWTRGSRGINQILIVQYNPTNKQQVVSQVFPWPQLSFPTHPIVDLISCSFTTRWTMWLPERVGSWLWMVDCNPSTKSLSLHLPLIHLPPTGTLQTLRLKSSNRNSRDPCSWNNLSLCATHWRGCSNSYPNTAHSDWKPTRLAWY